MATASSYRLTDRFVADTGTVFLSGTQALARIPIEQLRADKRAGHRTAAFVSGYPGSPLGGFDGAIASAARLATDVTIRHLPALNEEFGVTAVMGSQLAQSQPDALHDGVLGLWYGKAPGVDRAADALRHAVFAGTSPLGGAVALVGDDPLAKSSTIPSSSAGVLSDLHIPFLYPGDPAEALDLGRHAVVLSRVTGLWAALKIVADVADGTASVELDPDRVQPIVPAAAEMLAGRVPDGQLLTPHTLDIEREIYEVRYPLAVQYAMENRLNRATVDPADAWMGVISSGITYIEVKEALARLGLDSDNKIEAAGIRLIQMQMPVPFDRNRLRHLVTGLDEVFIIEEKHPHIESLVKDALYAQPNRPSIVGKLDENERSLVPGWSALDADAIVSVLRARLEGRIGDRLAPLPPPRRERIPIAIERSPFFCSGCPHNRSTQVPDGSLVGAGIGCHTMTMLMDPDRIGEIAGITCMGNEGTQWIGMEHFVGRGHLIQNLGDGTYFHSGQLAITAAIAAGTNITYKILYNDAVAMTGGQQPQGQIGVAALARNLQNQGVSQIIVTSDDVKRARSYRLPRAVKVWDRTRLQEAQLHLAGVGGVTVLIHDQACAAELRRARKRGKIPTPDKRVVINQRVCEGCGDCGQISNCLSVQPVDTPFGRKTHIDQSTCNLDFSCLEGDCPSFMTVSTSPGRLLSLWRGFTKGSATNTTVAGSPSSGTEVSDLPDPVVVVPRDELSIRLTGVGGTGVVTVAQIIGTAAMLSGYSVRGLDQIGLSQKAGPVVSDLTFSRNRTDHSSRLGAEQAHVLIALDQLVGASAKGLDVASRGTTVVVGSTSGAPTGHMITHPEVTMPSADDLAERLEAVSWAEHQHWADAAAITGAVFGDSVSANLFVVGMAYQAGALPVPVAPIIEAVELNGVAVEANLAAFELGRRFVADPAAVNALAADPVEASGHGDVDVVLGPLRDRISIFGGDPGLVDDLRLFTYELVMFQDIELADRYLSTIEAVSAREAAVAAGSTALTSAVAANLYRLLAYKDEYEVARLLLDDTALSEAGTVANGGRVTYRLHPPFLRAMGLKTKISLGPWSRPLFRILANGKAIRGRRIDPFGYAAVRKLERQLCVEYQDAVTTVIDSLTPENFDAAVRIASLPDQVRGYEHLKVQRAEQFREQLAEQIRLFQNA